jgi:hypothetical protein
MAVNDFTEFFVRTDGADTNGGGTDDAAATYTSADATVAGGTPTQITDNAATWGSPSVGDKIQWDTAGVQELAVITVVAGAVITVDRSLTPGANKSASIGGAWDTINFATQNLEADMRNATDDPVRDNIKAGTYAEQPTVANGGSSQFTITHQGYVSNPGDQPARGSQPIIDGTGIAGSSTWLGGGQIYINLKDVYVKATTASTDGVGSAGNHCSAIRVRASASDGSGDGISMGGTSCLIDQCCVDLAGRRGILAGGTNAVVKNSVVSHWGDVGILLGVNGVADNNLIFDGNGHGITFTSDTLSACGNTIFDIVGSCLHFFDLDTDTRPLIDNNIFAGWTDFAVSSSGVDDVLPLITHTATWDSKSTGQLFNHVTATEDMVVLSADPFVNSAAGNFNLNTTSGGGADCRAAGFPGDMDGTNIGFRDIGALQHEDSGGGGGSGGTRVIGPGMVIG